MIFLTGATNEEEEPSFISGGVGLMCQPGNSYHLRADRYDWHAADNGCFNAKWEEPKWSEWLATKMPTENCLFAVAPDVYGEAEATLERSAGFFELIRGLGFPVALVAQDGAEHLELPWDDFDALFIGGRSLSDLESGEREWKLSAGAMDLCQRARNRGKWVHMGRVNSLRRLAQATAMGCDSVDGTFTKYQRRRRAREGNSAEGLRHGRGSGSVISWVGAVNSIPSLFDTARETPSMDVHRRALS